MRVFRRSIEPPDPASLEIRRVLLASEGRAFPRPALEFVSSLRAPVRILCVARVYGTSFAFPNPWLRPSRHEWEEQRDNVRNAIKALERLDVEADGHVVGTRKATRAILREAAVRGCDAIVMPADPPRNRFVADMMWSQEPYRVRRRASIPVYLVAQ